VPYTPPGAAKIVPYRVTSSYRAAGGASGGLRAWEALCSERPFLPRRRPSTGTEGICSTRPQAALTEEELERFLGAIRTRGPAGKRNLALLTLLADAGLRLAEALGLETTDLVREKGGRVVTHVRVRGKGGKRATVPLTARAAARLDAWLTARAALGLGNGAVFCTITRGRGGGFGGEKDLTPGEPVNPRYVRYLVARLAQRAGLERRVTPHTLRHTFATHLLRKTGNLELTRKALRHARITTTAGIYSHLADRDVEEAMRSLREEPPPPPPDPQVAALAQALAGLTAEQRQALLTALGGQAA